VTPEPPDPAAVREALADATGSDPGELELSAIEGGASRETFLVSIEGSPQWVVRREPAAGMSFNSLEVELGAIKAADLAGVPVAPTLTFEPAGGRLGAGAGYLMEFVAGTSVAPRVLRREGLATARERLPAQLASALAQIHSVEATAVEGLAGGEADPAIEACELWERELDEVGEPLPAVEAGLRWLRLHPPPPPAGATLVHGDFRLGNLIVDEHGLTAVIDWELCHGGDPVEDLAWLCIRSWRFGNDDLPVAGVGELEPFLDAYEAAGGARPDAERLRWWDAMGNVKWAVICARQAHDHLTGARPSAELASLGRRICEPEWDLLRILANPAGSGREAEHPAGGIP
jgi:aminoglycoside phosphotransferase (APT) family kinase protein